MSTLTLTFRGPFLFFVPPPDATTGKPSDTVSIYAPKCDGHLASVFFGDGSNPIFGSFHEGGQQTYTLSGVNAPASGKTSYQWDFNSLLNKNPIVSPDSQIPPSPHATTFDSSYFQIMVPRPKIFYALNTVDDTAVVTETRTATTQKLLTSFRLYYDWDLSPISLDTPGGVDTWLVTPPAGKLPPGAPANWLPLSDTGDIEFRYESPDAGDLDHADANSCFDAIAALAGLKWFLRFTNSPTGTHFRTGADCLAIPLVIGINN